MSRLDFSWNLLKRASCINPIPFSPVPNLFEFWIIFPWYNVPAQLKIHFSLVKLVVSEPPIKESFARKSRTRTYLRITKRLLGCAIFRNHLSDRPDVCYCFHFSLSAVWEENFQMSKHCLKIHDFLDILVRFLEQKLAFPMKKIDLFSDKLRW